MQAGVSVLNGAGELTGSLEVAEWGWLASPVYLTATMSVGRVYDGAVEAAVARDARIGVDDVTIPVVGECDDSWLNDARVVQVEAEDTERALAGASAEFVAGCRRRRHRHGLLDWKGGIGSSSRAPPGGPTWSACWCSPTTATRPSFVSTACRWAGCWWTPGSARRRMEAARPRPPGAASRWSPPTPLCPRRSSLALRGAPAWDSRAPARWRTTEAARSSGLLDHGARRARRAAARLADREPRPQPDLHRDGRRDRGGGAERPLAAETTQGRDGRVIERLPHEPVLEQLARHGRLGG